MKLDNLKQLVKEELNRTLSENVRNKSRKSYQYKMWNFDLTKVVTRKSSIEEHSYEFEIELNKGINNINDSKYFLSSPSPIIINLN